MSKRSVLLLGIRGIPASHGGFETFAEKLSLYLVRQGWSVTVYCQEEGKGPIYETLWKGVRRIHIPVGGEGSVASVVFDLKSVLHSLRQDGVLLTLGYNTALFNVIHRLFGRTNYINMDGIEWKRQKWGRIAKSWFWMNERFGCWFGNHLIADHPRIMDHLATRVSRSKITMIPYGGDLVRSANAEKLGSIGIQPFQYSIVIARPEPENSILEIVKGFSKIKRHHKLVVLGKFDFANNQYHKQIQQVANDEVVLPGAIYEPHVVQALRHFARFYIHGHQVGGTNPSLVEALGAGNAVIAHDNPFNRWVASDSAIYFSSEDDLDVLFNTYLEEDNSWRNLQENSKKQHYNRFRWEKILGEYELLLDGACRDDSHLKEVAKASEKSTPDPTVISAECTIYGAGEGHEKKNYK